MKQILALLLLSAPGCASYVHVTDEKDAWIYRHRVFQDDDLLYCRANPTPDGGAAPICLEPRMNRR